LQNRCVPAVYTITLSGIAVSPRNSAMTISVSSICIVGFGAFGKLIATQLCPYFTIVLIDPAVHHLTDDFQGRVTIGSFADVSRCDLIILAVPVSDFKFVIASLKDQLKLGSVVVDVGSVKVNPTEVMLKELPAHVEIVGTHPLFGPQSTRNGIRGRKIAVCHIRGRSTSRIAAFLRRFLGLRVFFTTPEDHDKEAALVQGVTHLIAKVLIKMEPLPTRLTTASFDHLVQAIEMVRYDAPSVFHAIERANPYALEVRERFFALADEIRNELEQQI
jgi:prephenate dehydrogenase